ncbi:FtsX-like permease family protein [Bythopirellula goksoeyrii]|uniref:FtsX-like permease family protein n=1 Tax=Bythopirellula goksoeyrii TaxID=1400387 RepID=A0A5B9QDL8_9BACT|nr:FtsX-like permease family protein [Bythopirellula goksoeyrii]QEG36994.1 FtsX-like permease family protein [Bythopirellula goksoeyrii]
MSPLRYIFASLWQYRLTHFAVALGVAVATAVITGALLVGDSVRGSLRGLTLERLGGVDTVLVGEQPFREVLAEEFAKAVGKESEFKGFAPLLLVPGSLSATEGEQTKQATHLSILAVTDEFWQLGEVGPAKPTSGDDVAISQAIADELGAAVGDEVLLRVSLPSNIPADSTLGEKEDATTSRRLQIVAILNEGISRFSLQPSQLQPRNVFVSLTTMQRLLELPDRANVIAIGSVDGDQPSTSAEQAALKKGLRPELADFGLNVKEIELNNPRSHSGISNFLQLSAERLVLSPKLVETVRKRFKYDEPYPSGSLEYDGGGPSIRPVITYLANTIQLGDKKIPYSTVTGINSNAELGPLRDEKGQPILLAEDEIALNDWSARRLSAQVGDKITLTYYEPETTHGRLIEKSTSPLTLRVIAPLQTDDGQPTAVADPQFTPELPGVTDERSISDWDLPFKLVEKIEPEDEAYWDEYRTTPKAFVSYSLAEKLWSTRWGSVSALRLPIELGAPTVSQLTEFLTAAIKPSDLGMKLLPVKQQGLAAARGTTSFEGLFLGFSFFLLASAVMLIALLFRLGAESRAAEVGILAATGWGAKRLRQVWLGEAAIVALVGAVVGVLGGIAYAALMIHGLTTWWVAATVTPFLKLHITPQSLLTGFAIGVIVSLVTIVWSLRKLLRIPPRQLLAGDASDPSDIRSLQSKPRRQWLSVLLFILAVGIAAGALAGGLRDVAQAGAFFGSGALVLAGLLIWLRGRLRQASVSAPNALSLAGLSVRNARRNPGRTILAVALAAVASFLIVALSAFRLAPTESGTGGFDLIATSDLPIYFDLNTANGRKELGFTEEDEKLLSESTIYSFRVHGGEDASCLNLYQTTQPQVVGVPESFYADNQFGWAARKEGNQTTGWSLLDTAYEKDLQTIPIILDQNTATYSLHLGGIGAQITLRDAADQPVTAEVVGLLSGSILQGNVLMSETNFLRLYPDEAGRSLFLILADSPSNVDKISALLESRLVDFGFDAVNAHDRLADFLAVQNTYLSTFQSLGALGLLLGTIGLAVAQLRSAFERRGELALMRSAGFRRRRLSEMLLGENTVLLIAGLGFGCLAALVATLPHWALRQAGIPWVTLAFMLGAVAIAGIVAGWLAVRAALRMPLLSALRGE